MNNIFNANQIFSIQDYIYQKLYFYFFFYRSNKIIILPSIDFFFNFYPFQKQVCN